MEKEGNMAFLKIKFDINPEEIVENKLSFPNSKIARLIYREKNGFFYEFEFKTVFEYLGKKEEISNKIYMFKGKPIEGDLSKYSLLDGSESEIKIPDYKNSYFAAKEELKRRVQEKVNEISRMLEGSFEKERKRIENDFVSETKQFQEKLKEVADRLMEYARKGEIEKISEEKKLIDSMKEKSSFGDLEKDKERAIQLENQKHILNSENKLERAVIIYYPIYVFTLDIEKDNLKKTFSLEFDPVLDEVSGISCENCSNKVKEILVCPSGHSVCKNCFSVQFHFMVADRF